MASDDLFGALSQTELQARVCAATPFAARWRCKEVMRAVRRKVVPKGAFEDRSDGNNVATEALEIATRGARVSGDRRASRPKVSPF